MVGEIELGIGAANSIVVTAAHGGGTLTIDEDGSDIRSLENVALHSEDTELLARNAETCRGFAQLARLHLQKAYAVRANLSGDLCAKVDRHRLSSIREANAPREEGLIRSLSAKEKDSRVLQKEVALLGKEN